MVKTKLAKSALDAGWGTLKTLLEYKSAHAGSVFLKVSEVTPSRPARVAVRIAIIRKVE